LLGGGAAGDPFPGAADENRRGRRGPAPAGPPTGGGLLGGGDAPFPSAPGTPSTPGPAGEGRRGVFGRGRRGPEPSGPPTGGGLLGGDDSPFPDPSGPSTGSQSRLRDSGPVRRPGSASRSGGNAFPDPSAPAEEGRRSGRSRRTADPSGSSGPPTGSRGLFGRGRAEPEPDPFPDARAANAVGEGRRRDPDPSGPPTGGRGLLGPVPDDDRDDDPFTPAEGSRGLLDAADDGRRPGRSRRREPDPFPMAGPAQDELTHPVRQRRGDRPERGDRSMDRSIENDPTGHEAARAALRNMDHPPLPDATIVAVAAKDHGRAGRNLPAAIGVGVALGVLALTSLFVRPEAFVALASFVVVLSVWELSGALAAKQIVVPVIPVAVGALGMLVSAYVAGPEGLLVSYMLTAFGILLWRIVEGLDGAMRDVTAGLFVAAYVPLLAGFAILMLAADQGPKRVVTFILVTIASDIGGYIAGVLFGKHPMAPRISPKKSWEGFAGSMVACLIAGTACVVFLLDGPPWVGAVIGIAAVFTATGGDLSESLLKRDLGIKDMGNLLPGHGGIMDRMDSLLPSAPVVYLLLFFLL
ncbi:phosphatidate cytidylyltransferase, partial [Kineosporia mesophila]